jgi:hypothetical protein
MIPWGVVATLGSSSVPADRDRPAGRVADALHCASRPGVVGHRVAGSISAGTESCACSRDVGGRVERAASLH